MPKTMCKKAVKYNQVSFWHKYTRYAVTLWTLLMLTLKKGTVVLNLVIQIELILNGFKRKSLNG